MSTESIRLSVPEVYQSNRFMQPNEELSVSTVGQSATPASLNEETIGLKVPTVAIVKAGRQKFSVLDTAGTDEYSTPYLLVSDDFRHGSDTGFKGIRYDREVKVGRSHLTDRFEYGSTVSRDHFSIAFSALGLVIKNYEPLNGTRISGDIRPVGPQRKSPVIAEFTYRLGDDIRGRHDYGEVDQFAPYGYHKNHVIIGRDTKSVKDGVYFTTSPNSEAVIVDDKSRAIELVSQGLLDKVESKFSSGTTKHEEDILKLVNKETKRALPYDARISDRLSGPLCDSNGLIALSTYIEQGGGVCRHQCLLAALLLEKLIDNKILAGTVGVERNHDLDVKGAHAWAVFKSLSGSTIVVDPAQNFVGSKARARAQGRWEYEIPLEY